MTETSAANKLPPPLNSRFSDLATLPEHGPHFWALAAGCVAICLVFASADSASANACKTAEKRQNSFVTNLHQSNVPRLKKIKAELGIKPTTPLDENNPAHCVKALPFWVSVLPSFLEAERLTNVLDQTCSKVTYIKLTKDSIPVAQIVRQLRNDIPACERALAAASTPSQVARNVTGASAPSASPSPAAKRPWSGRKEDCESAGRLERNTASWYDVCVLTSNAAPRLSSYQPPISPQNLTVRAADQCKTASGETKQACVFNAKMSILLADDPNVRAECRAKSSSQQIACVDAVYLYGPGASENGRAEKENLRRKIAALPGYSVDIDMPTSQPSDLPRDRSCSPGFGMKPQPGAFGAWSCQKLGTIIIGRDRKAANSAEKRDDAESAAEDFEERLRDIAANAAVAATNSQSSAMSDADRETCRIQAYWAVHSAMKGGVPETSEKCSATISAARAELAYYAAAHVDTLSNPGAEELLAAIGETRVSTINASDCSSAETHWKSAEDIRSVMAYQDHIARFPACNFAGLAAARIQQLKKR